MSLSASRPLYRPDELARTFAPRSIAVVGVSTNPASFGSITYANIAGPGRFAGPVYMVNAKYERIGEKPCYPSIAALPETPDCVFVAVPRDAVEAVVAECAQRGVGGVVLFSSGFGETALPERVAQQQRLVESHAARACACWGPIASAS
jgi:acyl-CoA synthetase (NDP forming)